MSKAIATSIVLVSLAAVLLGLAAGTAYGAYVEVRKPLAAVVVVAPQMAPVIPGDVDANGVVDISDLGLVASSFNQIAPGYRLADVNQDGLVDIYDLVQVGANFGRSQK